MTLRAAVWDQPCPVPQGAPIAVITIGDGPGQGQSIRLRRAASLLGTKLGCKLVLRHPRINRRHCVIVNTGSQLILRDLNTQGQTLRNGLKVEEEVLTDADRLKLGPWEFAVTIEEPSMTGNSDSPIIVDLEPDPTVLAIEDLTTQKLIKLSHTVSILGRGPGVDAHIEDREVSNVHAVVFTYLHKPVIFDLLSENGTFVNGERAVFAVLHNEDEISLGARKLRFRCNSPSRAQINGSASSVLRPTPFDTPDGTLSDLIDLSADSMLNR